MLIVAAALAVSTLIPSVATSQPPAPGGGNAERPKQAAADHHEGDPKAEDRGTNASPLIVEIPPTKEQQRESAEVTKERQGNATREWWLIRLTGLLTAATIALGVFTYLLWRTTAKAVSDTAQAITLAKTANEIAERAIVEQKRPWVFVENVVPDRDSAHLKVIFRNSGATPAKSFRKAIYSHVLPLPFPSSNLPNLQDGTATFLPPGASEVMMLPNPPKMKEGYEYRIRIALDYMIHKKTRDRLDVDFAVRNDGTVRKVTPEDYAAYKGVDSYTFDLEGFPIGE